MRLADDFNRRFVNQGIREHRTLDDTLTRAWSVTSLLPRRELTMLSTAVLDAHHDTGAAERPS